MKTIILVQYSDIDGHAPDVYSNWKTAEAGVKKYIEFRKQHCKISNIQIREKTNMRPFKLAEKIYNFKCVYGRDKYLDHFETITLREIELNKTGHIPSSFNGGQK